MSNAPFPQTASSVWRSEAFDLDRYLAFIGLSGNLGPTLGTLQALQRAHVSHIKWESVDMVLGRPAPLDVPTLLDRVAQGRGMTCEGHTTLFAAALAAVGFHVECRSARVRLGSSKVTAASHAVVWANVDGTAYLCDVGFGEGPLAPVPLVDGAKIKVNSWEHEMRRQQGQWVLWAKRPDGWIDLHGFAAAPRYPVDNVCTNHFLSTHPRSPFRASPRAVRMTPDRLMVFEKGALTVSTAAEVLSREEFEPQETSTVLEERFGVVLSAGDRALLVERVLAATAV